MLGGRIKEFFCPDTQSFEIIGNPLEPHMKVLELSVNSCNNLRKEKNPKVKC